ncbi:sulfatase-like hydrolase/transferase [Pontiellaceae bacterium B12227]|nr:sulfatase-like hydrolase/transferase [Pontiellaceae bacterium B12227]
MKLSKFIGLALLGGISCFGDASQQPPNVVLIFADDLGYGDVGCYGATKLQTPNIDKLATEGRRFTDAHSASAVCTPSRYGLLTGQYPYKADGGQGIWKPTAIDAALLINTDMQTIADVFKSQGYDTAVIGKWHLGFGTGKNDWKEPLRPGPQDLGFDYYFGMPVVNSCPPYVYVENDRVVGSDPNDPLIYLGSKAKPGQVTPITPIPKEAAQRTPNHFGGAVKAHKLFNDYEVGTKLTEKATDWIKGRDGKPFFMYFATTAVHHPFTPAKRFQGTSQCGVYGDFVHELDWIVGEVMKTLEEVGAADNTLVIFTSDNGGMFNHGGRAAAELGHSINGRLLGSKFGIWEGGHRVPFIAWWPGKVEAGSVSDQMLMSVDLKATFAAVSGYELSPAEQQDSINMLPALTGNPDQPLRSEMAVTCRKASHMALRKGKWMYIPAKSDGGFGGSKPGQHAWGGAAVTKLVHTPNSDIVNGKIKPNAPRAQLYDLEADPNQTKNLFNQYPEVVQEMATELKALRPVAQNDGTMRKKSAPAKKTSEAKKNPAPAGKRSASFDFESGNLEPWKVVEGSFGHVVGNREMFFANKGVYNKQGTFYLTTLESAAGAEKGNDKQIGVIVSPLFIAEGGSMTFRVGGGKGPQTYVALCTEAGKEVLKAHGVNNQEMQHMSWDLAPYSGQKMFIKVVDNATAGWGHITADHFEFDAQILEQYSY